MVERPKIAPPAVELSGVTDRTALAPDLFAEFWPPSGWPMFACINRPSGMITANTLDLKVSQSILKYEVRRDDSGVYTIEILSGTLTRTGEISLNPVLGIRFSGREDWYEEDARPEEDVLDLYASGKQLTPERSLILRMILAITFLISRIDRGLMPNLKKTMKLYRLS